MGRVRSVCAARTVMREAARGALRALRAPVRSTLAVNCWGAMAEDMVEEGVVELINLCVRRDDRRGALPGALYRPSIYPFAYLSGRKAHQPEAVCD